MGADMDNDWLYSPDRMALRGSCLLVLLKRYAPYLTVEGIPSNSSEKIYACAHDWVSQGNPVSDGIERYYERYYQESQ